MMDSIWINIGTLLMNAAMDKGVLQEMLTSLLFSISSAISSFNLFLVQL